MQLEPDMEPIDPSTTLLGAVRARLRREPQLALGPLARTLGMSARTLQRALECAGTTLSQQRDRVRTERIVLLLGDRSNKLDLIAREVGCADRRSLNRLFRRVTGESPASFRARCLSCPERARPRQSTR